MERDARAVTTASVDELLRENEALRRRLEEAEAALRALSAGEADAVLVTRESEQVYVLEAADRPFRLLVEQMDQGTAIVRPDGTILQCNPQFGDRLAPSATEVLGRRLRDFVVDESRAVVEAFLRDGGLAETRCEVVLAGADGVERDICWTASPLAESAHGACLLVRDVTEQLRLEELRRARDALRASEENLSKELAAARRLHAISSRLLLEDDSEQLYHLILDAAVEIMRSDVATMQVLDESHSELRPIARRRSGEPGASVAAIAPALEPTIEAGVGAVLQTPLLSRGGRLVGLISSYWRETHQPEERDLQLLDVLARQAADLIERKRHEDALRKADRRKDEFLATLAHELRNPLAPIRNATQILKSKPSKDPQILWCRDVIERQVTLMARLLEDLLDVSRISRNMLRLRRERVALADVVEVAVETSRPLIEAAGHELVVDLPDAPVILEADPLRVEQILSNLLNNAAKYTEEGGRIVLTGRCEGDLLTVAVADNGIGIAAEALPEVFEMFSQDKSSMSRAQGGLGVGLSLVRGLAALHGGTIEAKSDGPGRGSEFVLRLPVVVAGSDCAPARTKIEGIRAPKSFRILIVDDNQDSADSLAKLLEVMGHDVEVAYDGAEGLAAASESRPDVVLLDIGMPQLDGYETCRRIHAEPWGREILLVALTGWGQDEDRRKTDEAGFDEHIVKPVDAQALLKLLARRRAAASTR
jgi:PAS domain S-box-containing protein